MTNIYRSYFEKRKVYGIQPLFITWKFLKNLFAVKLVFNRKFLSKEKYVPENFK